MNIIKRNKYIDNMYCALHTLSGRCTGLNETAAMNGHAALKKFNSKKMPGSDERKYYVELNPNKAAVGNGMLIRYSDADTVLNDVLNQIQAESFEYTRADLSFNSEGTGDFDLYKKLNRLLICCTALSYGIDNTYQTYDLWTFKALNTAIRSQFIAMENYDKKEESGGSCPVTNRLEIRSLRIPSGRTLKDEFTIQWFKRLDAAVECFEEVQIRYNQELSYLYLSDLQKPKKDRDFISLTGFVLQFKECFFTRKQLENFFELIPEVENPKNRAKKFKEHHKIEFFTKTDLQIIVKALKSATLDYFNS